VAQILLVFLDGKLKDHFNESEKHINILENPKAHGAGQFGTSEDSGVYK
jgi:hypothetical protein